ncbi:hypothetical protein [Winogradskyella aquimaris]|uniref:Uncharacterized protein n=1 Tax=Winogradskyella aquimaris TaxID=864074 RepID=A0ABU5EHW9_9FLAO|nr:hypothetical protein [Winogradskyella aquimaris]MDY2585834.1 hypothetical protein [Winogradskyella aquimaris]
MSIVYFSINGRSYECKVQQPYGGSDGTFEEDPLEVFIPDELKNELNYEQFRQATEKYYRMCVGSEGMLGVKGENIQLSSLFFERNHVEEIETTTKSGAW